MVAARWGMTGVVSLLLEAGAKTDLQNEVCIMLVNVHVGLRTSIVLLHRSPFRAIHYNYRVCKFPSTLETSIAQNLSILFFPFA